MSKHYQAWSSSVKQTRVPMVILKSMRNYYVCVTVFSKVVAPVSTQ